MGPNESGLDAEARLKTPRPMHIYVHINMYIYHIEVGSDEETVAISTERKNNINLLMACSRNFSIFPSANAQMPPTPLK
jgi:hypothetical protein